MAIATAREKIKGIFLNQNELADLLNVSPDRIRDLRSHHKKKKNFIDSYQPTARSVFFHVDDVLKYIYKSKDKNLDLVKFKTS